MKNKILNCPCCKREAQVYYTEEKGDSWWGVCCKYCPIQIDDEYETKEEAIRVWNHWVGLDRLPLVEEKDIICLREGGPHPKTCDCFHCHKKN